MHVTPEFTSKLAQCLTKVKYWKGNENVCGSHVELGPYRQVDVDNDKIGRPVPVYSLRRTIRQRAGTTVVTYEIIHIDVEPFTNEPIPNFYTV